MAEFTENSTNDIERWLRVKAPEVFTEDINKALAMLDLAFLGRDLDDRKAVALVKAAQRSGKFKSFIFDLWEQEYTDGFHIMKRYGLKPLERNLEDAYKFAVNKVGGCMAWDRTNKKAYYVFPVNAETLQEIVEHEKNLQERREKLQAEYDNVKAQIEELKGRRQYLDHELGLLALTNSSNDIAKYKFLMEL